MDLLRFFMIIGKLKNERRRGWVLRGVENPESVADHSYMTAVMCMLLADDTVDKDKAVKMALVHDMAESVVGDLTPDDIDRESKHEKEKNAMIEIVALLPGLQGKDIMDLWLEFEQGSTNEAIFVKEIDLLDLVMQALEYEKDSKKNMIFLTGQEIR